MSGLFACSAISYVTETSDEYGRDLKIESERITPPQCCAAFFLAETSLPLLFIITSFSLPVAGILGPPK